MVVLACSGANFPRSFIYMFPPRCVFTIDLVRYPDHEGGVSGPANIFAQRQLLAPR